MLHRTIPFSPGANKIVNDDVLFRLGTDGDNVLVHRSSSLTADTALTDVIVGTPVVAAIPANSLIISNVTADGDIVFITQTGGNSQEMMRLDGSTKFVSIGRNLTAPLGALHIKDANGFLYVEREVASGAFSGGTVAVMCDDGAAMGDGHRLGAYVFSGAEDASNNLIVGARIEAYADAAWSTSENGTRLVIKTTDGDAVETEAIRITSDQQVIIGDGSTTKASVQTGPALVIDSALSVVGDPVIEFIDAGTTAHGGLSGVFGGDTWGFIRQGSAEGQMNVEGVMSGSGANPRGLILAGLVEQNLNTTRTSAGAVAGIELFGYQISGGAAANAVADGNVMAVKTYRGGAFVALFLVDEDGDFQYDGADGGAYDAYDDLSMVRAFDLATANPDTLIRSEWDQFVTHNEADLIQAGILGAPVKEGGLVNGAQLLRLHNGAITQIGHQLYSQEDRITALETENRELRALIGA